VESRDQLTPDLEPLLSVVIIGLNEEERIAACIDSVRLAIEEINSTEVVFVDSGSTDRTVQVALSKGLRVVALGPKQPPSPSAGRYVGSVVTKGRFILFVDGDTKIATGWISLFLRRMQEDSSTIMMAGKIDNKQGNAYLRLNKINDLGTVESVYSVSGSWAPIVQRKALEKAGHWNPFVRCREEEDLTIRLRYYVPGCKILQSDCSTFTSPKTAIYRPHEFIKRLKSGFIKGPGLTLRNAIAHGYWRLCWNISKPILFVIALIVSLIVSFIFKVWWQCGLIFLGIVTFHAVIRKTPIVFANIFYLILIGVCSLMEMFNNKVRTASDYVCDYQEVVISNDDMKGS
jgi:glycosyltransferase involved in cell wall biosynthesis